MLSGEELAVDRMLALYGRAASTRSHPGLTAPASLPRQISGVVRRCPISGRLRTRALVSPTAVLTSITSETQMHLPTHH
jgi:hypothetical protein